MKTSNAWLLYNVAVLVTIVLLVHYLSWLGLAGMLALSSYSDQNNK